MERECERESASSDTTKEEREREREREKHTMNTSPLLSPSPSLPPLPLLKVPTKLETFACLTGTPRGPVAVRVRAGDAFSLVLTSSKQVFSWGFSGSRFHLGLRML